VLSFALSAVFSKTLTLEPWFPWDPERAFENAGMMGPLRRPLIR
jgi:hypothetical protein